MVASGLCSPDRLQSTQSFLNLGFFLRHVRVCRYYNSLFLKKERAIRCGVSTSSSYIYYLSYVRKVFYCYLAINTAIRTKRDRKVSDHIGYQNMYLIVVIVMFSNLATDVPKPSRALVKTVPTWYVYLTVILLLLYYIINHF